MAQNILMMGPLPAAQMQQLEENYSVLKLWQEPDPEASLNQVREKVTGIVGVFDRNVSGKLIRALPNLEIIANYAVGYDNIDIQAAREQGVVVTNTPGVSADDIADLTLGMVLGVLRRMVEGDIYVRTGQWAKRGAMPLGRSVRGRTMGIVGMGRVGKAIARRAEAFGMEVVYFGPRKKPEVPYSYYHNLQKMAEDCDILTVACSYSPATHQLIDANILKLLGKNGVLINIARGRVVNEQDLVDALESGVIAGAGLDVFENEPDVPSALCRLDNVVLQPHQASATVESSTAEAQLVVDNLRSYFEKAEVLTPV
ncbi:MAG: 2-hydroxyacid dehydrogenase [Alphaproteobacteria bacterium]|nr:2-hydroxyacid dehydrogenase [Alphaproteobacteria bacterium]